ncbi:TPA: hypothetical protein ACOEHG_005212 [Enterobacter ludwigii]
MEFQNPAEQGGGGLWIVLPDITTSAVFNRFPVHLSPWCAILYRN